MLAVALLQSTVGQQQVVQAGERKERRLHGDLSRLLLWVMTNKHWTAVTLLLLLVERG
jgi:hypothetical protein